MPLNELSRVWSFGLQSAGIGEILGSTGVGVAYDTRGNATFHAFYVETQAGSTASYAILTGRTSTGPWAILSSGTLAASTCAVTNVTGILSFVTPRIKTITSTAATVFVQLLG